MNKRIQEMAEEAKLNTALLVYKEKLEHFAELIVLECANIVYTAVEHREPASTYVSKILELRNETSKAD
jgi:hypothetical protein